LTIWALHVVCCIELRSGTTLAMTENDSGVSSSRDPAKILRGGMQHFDDRDLRTNKTTPPVPSDMLTLAPSSVSAVSTPNTTNASSSTFPFQAVLRWALFVPFLALAIMAWAVRKQFGGSSSRGELCCCLECSCFFSTDPDIPEEIIVNDNVQENSVASSLENRRNVHVDMELPAWSSSMAILTPFSHKCHSPHRGNPGFGEAPSDEEESTCLASFCGGQATSRPRSVVTTSSSSSSCSFDITRDSSYTRMTGHS
jgi:hypothetical protein